MVLVERIRGADRYLGAGTGVGGIVSTDEMSEMREKIEDLRALLREARQKPPPVSRRLDHLIQVAESIDRRLENIETRVMLPPSEDPRNRVAKRLVLPVAEVAELLGVSVRTLRSQVAAGKIPTVKIGKRVGILAKDLDRYITECRRGDDAAWRRYQSRKHPRMDGTWTQDLLSGR